MDMIKRQGNFVSRLCDAIKGLGSEENGIAGKVSVSISMDSDKSDTMHFFEEGSGISRYSLMDISVETKTVIGDESFAEDEIYAAVEGELSRKIEEVVGTGRCVVAGTGMDVSEDGEDLHGRIQNDLRKGWTRLSSETRMGTFVLRDLCRIEDGFFAWLLFETADANVFGDKDEEGKAECRIELCTRLYVGVKSGGAIMLLGKNGGVVFLKGEGHDRSFSVRFRYADENVDIATFLEYAGRWNPFTWSPFKCENETISFGRSLAESIKRIFCFFKGRHGNERDAVEGMLDCLCKGGKE